jgi:hypothetical protein
MATASGRTVFVLGQEVDGNREVVVVENGEEYTMDAATIVTYSDGSATFPYTS